MRQADYPAEVRQQKWLRLKLFFSILTTTWLCALLITPVVRIGFPVEQAIYTGFSALGFSLPLTGFVWSIAQIRARSFEPISRPNFWATLGVGIMAAGGKYAELRRTGITHDEAQLSQFVGVQGVIIVLSALALVYLTLRRRFDVRQSGDHR